MRSYDPVTAELSGKRPAYQLCCTVVRKKERFVVSWEAEGPCTADVECP